jgi:hypothetical protein
MEIVCRQNPYLYLTIPTSKDEHGTNIGFYYAWNKDTNNRDILRFEFGKQKMTDIVECRKPHNMVFDY